MCKKDIYDIVKDVPNSGEYRHWTFGSLCVILLLAFLRKEVIALTKTLLSSGVMQAGRLLGKLLLLWGTYYLVEVLALLLLTPQDTTALAFGALWSGLLTLLVLLLPRLAGQVVFGITYGFAVAWTLAQVGYYIVFGKMMWLTDMLYAGEGADYLGDILADFPFLWWIGGIVLLILGGLIIWKFPRFHKNIAAGAAYTLMAAGMVVGLCLLPEAVFERDKDIWGTRSEYGQSSSYRATYNTMYDAKKVYNICGVYHLTFRDVWVHLLYPLTPAYQAELQEQTAQIDQYFADRGDHQDNGMTGVFADKNVILVLMESMDDWLITQEDTPTLVRLMGEGINFTNFYTPGYGTVRTFNTEFCMNTGIYLPTNGDYVFNYVTNDFDQSIASILNDQGYSSQVFHYNSPSFYSRGVFEQAMGYEAYHSYEDYVTDKNQLYDDSFLFENEALRSLFFRDGQTFNFIITRSAHLSYTYNEVLSHYALKQYPEYRGKYGSQEEDCARVKAKLVDDMFARLLAELEAEGQLENTVIIGVTDHYTYGYKNTQELFAHSQVSDSLLLEKTPCFIWTADGPAITVDKTLNTSDLLPTVLNLMGVDAPYDYLGQDAFDPNYVGYALFPDGSWICDGIVSKVTDGGEMEILSNPENKLLTDEQLNRIVEMHRKYMQISNLLLSSNYYQSAR